MFRTAGWKSSTTNPMVSNPTYEGQPVYDTINTGKFSLSLPLPPTPSSNTTKFNSSPPLDSPYDSEPTPYNHCSKITASPPSLEEDYTVMKSAGGQYKGMESQGFSSGHVPSEMVRYVPEPRLHHTEAC